MKAIHDWTVVEQARTTVDRLGQQKHGGGVAIVLIKPDISVVKISYHFHTTQFEYIVGRVTYNTHSSFMLVVLYRPGGSKLKPKFFEDLEQLLTKVSRPGLEIVLAGDINIYMNLSDSSTHDFLDVVKMFHLGQHVCLPTHEAGNTIDIVCSRHNRSCLNMKVADVGLSDHSIILWTLPLLDATASAGPVNGRKRPLSDGH